MKKQVDKNKGWVTIDDLPDTSHTLDLDTWNIRDIGNQFTTQLNEQMYGDGPGAMVMGTVTLASTVPTSLPLTGLAQTYRNATTPVTPGTELPRSATAIEALRQIPMVQVDPFVPQDEVWFANGSTMQLRRQGRMRKPVPLWMKYLKRIKKRLRRK